MTRIFHDLCLLCISDLNLRPNATMKSWKSITKIIYSSIFLLVDISSVSKNMNSITARILNRKKRFWNEQFCLILQKKHTWVGKLVWRLRISSIVFEIDWKRNDLKYESFGELNWSGMYYMCDLSMVYEVHEYIPLQSNSPYRSGLTKGMPLSKHVLEILARYTSLPTQVCVFCKIVLNQAKIYI